MSPRIANLLLLLCGASGCLDVLAGLSYATFIGTECDRTPFGCGGMTMGTGVMSLGPYPSARVDYIVIESADSSGCGPYAVTLRRL